MNRDPIKIILTLGFAAVLALMVLIAFIPISRLEISINELSTLLEQTSAKIAAANTMRDSIRLRGDTLYEMYLTDDYIERDRLRLELARHGLQYKQARDRLNRYPMSARERHLLATLIEETRRAKQLNDEAAEILLSDTDDASIRRQLKQANKARRDMLDGLNQLVALQEDNARRIVHDSYRYHHIITRIIILLSAAAFFIALLIAMVVIRETARKNTEIRYRATHDELTGLVNRKEFEQLLNQAFLQSRQKKTAHALCLLDLDNFKQINDSCGHKAGDALLSQLSQRIRGAIRRHDVLARLGGDEFGLLLNGCSIDKAIEITEGIVSLVRNHPFHWEGKTFHVGVSIGISQLDANSRSVQAALHDADMACYAAKDMGKNQVQVHQLDDKAVRHINRQLSWVANTEQSIAEQRFHLFIQPIDAIDEPNHNDDGELHRFEVLLRMQDDDNSLLSPAAYIPVAERFRLMARLDHWVCDAIFARLATLRHQIDITHLRLFINLSENALTDPDFPGLVLDLQQRYGIAGRNVVFEIDAGAAIKHINFTTALIQQLGARQFRFSLEHVGKDLGCLSWLGHLPVDYLKIDGELIRKLPGDTASKAIIAAIKEAGQVLNIGIIAEQVEDAFTLKQLQQLGIRLVQGYRQGAPVSIAELLARVQKNSAGQNYGAS